MAPRRLRLVTPIESDDTDSLSEPPIYPSNVLPPSYTTRHFGIPSPTGPRPPPTAHIPKPSYASSTATSADADQTQTTSLNFDSETYVSDDASQAYHECIGELPLTPSSAYSARVGYGDRKAVMGGSDSSSIFSRPTTSTIGGLEPRYLYYQVYSDGEAVLSKTSFTEEDPYVGRIIAKRISPPHTAGSIKRYLSKQEDIADYNRTSLFTSLSSPFPLQDHSHLSILTTDGPGCILEEPMALVISEQPKEPISPPTPPLMTQAYSPSIVTVESEPHPSSPTQVSEPPKEPIAAPSGPPVMAESFSPIVTVDRDPFPTYPMHVQSIPAPIGHCPSKEEVKQRKAEEKKKKKAEAKAKTERLALQLKESAKRRAEVAAQEKANIRSGRRAPEPPSLFGGLVGLY